jgi:hypothetical protein
VPVELVLVPIGSEHEYIVDTGLEPNEFVDRLAWNSFCLKPISTCTEPVVQRSQVRDARALLIRN